LEQSEGAKQPMQINQHKMPCDWQSKNIAKQQHWTPSQRGRHAKHLQDNNSTPSTPFH